MAQHSQPVRVEGIDWPALLPFVHIFKSFRMAVHPAKLMLALTLILALYGFGWILDSIPLVGDRVYPDELSRYAQQPVDNVAQWRRSIEVELLDALRTQLVGLPQEQVSKLQTQLRNDDEPYADKVKAVLGAVNTHFDKQVQLKRQQGLTGVDLRLQLRALGHSRAMHLRRVKQLAPQPVFLATLSFKLQTFSHLVRAAASFNLGSTEQLMHHGYNRNTVVGALRELMVTLPGWMFHVHRSFLIVWMIGAMALWALLGGAIARMTALHATRDQRISITAALGFVRVKWIWFFISPLLPLLFVWLIWLIMALGGVLFNVPMILDVVAALLFFLALLGGFVAALLLIGMAGGMNLLFPAIAVEGSESLDAISRAYHYVFFKPWRLILYNLAALIYGAITYLFVGFVVFLTLWLAQHFVGSWVLVSVEHGAADRFDALLPRPQIGTLLHEIDWSVLSVSGMVAAAVIRIWVFLLTALLGAYAISYYFSANTWIYLLLRRAADDTAFDDVYDEQANDSAGQTGQTGQTGGAGGAGGAESAAVQPTPS